MQRSRKGTRLNDADYFRKSLPPFTKKLTKARLSQLLLTDRNLKNFDDNEKKIRIHHSHALKRDQPSIEMTKITFMNPKNNKKFEKDNAECKNISVQLHSEELLLKDNSSLSTKLDDVDVEQTEVPSLFEEVIVEESFKCEEIFVVKDAECTTSLNYCENNEEMNNQAENNTEDEQVSHNCKVNRVVNNEEKFKREEKSWWRMIIDFFSLFWIKRNNEKRTKKNKTRKSEGKTLIHGKQEDSNIKKIYISSLGRDKLREKKRKNFGVDGRNPENEDIDNLISRQMSSPLY